MTPRALLLDMDGVLIDTSALHTAAWAEALAPRGVVVDRALYLARANGRARDDALRALAGEVVDPEQVLAAKGEAALRLLHEVPPTVFPGTVAWLAAARRQGWRLAVASSSRMTEALLAAASLGDFDAVVHRGMVARGKPAPDLFLEAARRVGVPPARCVVVEDSPAGVQAGRAAGCRVVAVRTSVGDDQLRGAHAIVDRLADVPLDERNLAGET